MADAIAKFWVMPRTGTALSPVDSTSAGVTATKGFNLAADLIGGLPELEDQIGGTMVATSGQTRAERVTTAVRQLQPFELEFRDIRNPYATGTQPGAGTVFARSVIDARPDNAAPWRVEIEYGSGETVSSFNVQFGNRKTIPAGLSLQFLPTGPVTQPTCTARCVGHMGAWTGWSTKYNWVSRRAAYVEWTVRECQDAIQIGLVQIRRRFIERSEHAAKRRRHTRSASCLTNRLRTLPAHRESGRARRAV